MSDEDPVRLKDQGSASPELVRALRALGSSSDGARLERVAQKLGAKLAEAPPPMAATRGGLLGAKGVIVAVVVTGIAALGWFGLSARAPQPQRPPAPIAALPPQPPSPPPPMAADEPRPPAPDPLPSPSPSPRHASAARALPHHKTAAERPAVTPAADAANDDAHASAQPAAQDAPQAPMQPRPATAEAPKPPQPSAAQPLPSEAALLFGARKAMPSQPMAALQLLEQHAARFPDGLLAPEREVLRIQALRRLGRTAEADQRLRAFQARYPDSIHLRRLQTPDADAR